MLEIQGPPSMPHAVPFGRPGNVFTPQPYPRVNNPQLHNVHSTHSLPSSTNPTPISSTSSRHYTPQSEMNVGINNGRMGSQHPGLQTSKDTSTYGQQYTRPQQSHAYSDSSFPKQAASSLNGAAKSFPSPRSHRSTAQESKDSGRTTENNVAPSLRVPDTVRTPQSGIAQLAAEVTCLFWFEDAATIDKIETLPSPPPPPLVTPLCADATPSVGFRKWVSTILSTTQVTREVILLALMFIWRLKKNNADVKGKPGSEFRLLTVALMLGNKFLDDNTYTNKTWAEVSGISVQEVHIMEVEFLSNMRYSLFTTEAEWDSWHTTLGKFGTYIDASTRMIHEQALRQAALQTPTLQMPPSLPSPPVSHHASPPFGHSTSPYNRTRTNTPMLLPQIGSRTVSPIGPLPELNLGPMPRKRSYDEQAEEPPPKRLSRPVTVPAQHSTAMTTPQRANQQPSGLGQRLPLPALTIPTLANTAPPTQLSGNQLPPPGRAMAMLYPPASQTSSLPTSITPILPTNLSPYPASGTSSPMSATFGHGQIRSPSYFLQQRSSPYRPVRQPRMLLIPPPSASQSAPQNVPHTHMQYQPLGRPAERYTGQLPYTHHEGWPQTHHYNQWPTHTPR